MIGTKSLYARTVVAILLFAFLIVSYLPAAADTTGSPDTALASWREQFVMQQASLQASVLAARATDPVLLRPQAGLTTQDIATQLSAHLGVDVQAYSKVPGWTSVRVPQGFTTDQVLQQINDSSLAEVASRHGRFYICEVPNDEYCVDKIPAINWDTFEWEDLGQYWLFDVNAPQAWDMQHGSPDTTIAIIDSGISIYHEDFRDFRDPENPFDNIWHNPGEIPNNDVDDDGNGFIDDYWGWDFVGSNIGSTDEMSDPDTYMPRDDEYPTAWDNNWWLGTDPWSSDPAIGNGEDDNGDWAPDAGVTHGTMVAGIAGAITNNRNDTAGFGGDIAGMSWNCKLMPVRVVNPEGWGWDEDAAAAIWYAADHGADVINMSFSFGLREVVPEATLIMMEEAIQHAVSQGCIVVGAVGNSGGSVGYLGGLDFPADMSETIAVGAVDWEGEHSSYSNWATGDDILDVVAPGDHILTVSLMDMYTWLVYESFFPGEFDLGEHLIDIAGAGTSFSTPIVSGFAGLLKARYPGMTYQQFREFIQQTAVDLNESTYPGYDIYLGYGRLDAYEAILYADENIPEPSTTALFLLGLAGLAGYRRLRRK